MDELRDNSFLESKLWRRGSSVLWENFFPRCESFFPFSKVSDFVEESVPRLYRIEIQAVRTNPGGDLLVRDRGVTGAK